MNKVILTIKHLKIPTIGPNAYHSGTYETQYLTKIINALIIRGSFPSAWKHATVTFIFKSGDLNNVNNYRPISLFPVLSEVVEKVVAQQPTAFLQSKELLSKRQHGFKARLSTETAPTTLTNKLYG